MKFSMLKPILQPPISAMHCASLKEVFTFCVAKKLKKSIDYGKTSDFTDVYLTVRISFLNFPV